MRILFFTLICLFLISKCNFKKKLDEKGRLFYDSDKKLLLYNFEYNETIYLLSDDADVSISGDTFLILPYNFNNDLEYCGEINPEMKCFESKEKIWGYVKSITLHNGIFSNKYKCFVMVFDKSFENYLNQKGKDETISSIDYFLNYQKEHGFLIELKYVELN